jgi:hypothetical protein
MHQRGRPADGARHYAGTGSRCHRIPLTAQQLAWVGVRQ